MLGFILELLNRHPTSSIALRVQDFLFLWLIWAVLSRLIELPSYKAISLRVEVGCFILKSGFANCVHSSLALSGHIVLNNIQLWIICSLVFEERMCCVFNLKRPAFHTSWIPDLHLLDIIVKGYDLIIRCVSRERVRVIEGHVRRIRCYLSGGELNGLQSRLPLFIKLWSWVSGELELLSILRRAVCWNVMVKSTDAVSPRCLVIFIVINLLYLGLSPKIMLF